jgi:hypothetical protein
METMGRPITNGKGLKKPISYPTLNRWAKGGWMRWMRENPVFFRDIFGDMSIEEAWQEIMNIKRDFMDLDDNSLVVRDGVTLNREGD